MKRLLMLMLTVVFIFVFNACEDSETDPLEDPISDFESYEVPDIPPEIAELMSDEDIALFNAGPGKEYIQTVKNRSIAGHLNGPARWHPIMMRFSYNLQFVPIGGTGCELGQWEPCFGPGAPVDPSECMANNVGATGITEGNGKWLGSPVHAIYTPVFCALSDYSGYGEGFYKAEEGTLWLQGQQDAPVYDEVGNTTFIRHSIFIANKSTGAFEGAEGWEKATIYTLAENNPFNTPDGTGYSDAVHFGWVFF